MAYPIRVEVDYQEEHDRMTTFFRYLMMIPALIMAGLIGFAASIVAMVAWFAIMITGRYPQGMHEFVAKALRWQTRVNAYGMLLTDVYPPFNGDEADYPIRVQVDYQENHDRMTTFFRYLMMIPALIMAGLIGFAASIVAMVAWFAIMFTGRYPQGMHEFVAKALRWQTRVNAYGMLLTDVYPPFNGDPD